MAKHNLALLLRDGKGAPRNGREAVELLRSAARQGMAASMFILGDIYERGDAAPKEPATALAWFAITSEFERQMNRGTETPLAKTATQRAQALQRILTPAELERAQQLGQSGVQADRRGTRSRRSRRHHRRSRPPRPCRRRRHRPPTSIRRAGRKCANDQIRAIQQALFDLKLLRDKPDGAMGPVTRTAIRDFQRDAALRETGEPTRDVYAALRDALGRPDVVANSPLPTPPKVDPAKTEPQPPEPPKVEAKPEPPKAEPAKPEPAKPEVAKTEPPKPPPPPAAVDLGKPEPPPAPPTSADIARAAPKIETPQPGPAKPDPNAWPTAGVDQVKAVQALLRELNFSREPPGWHQRSGDACGDPRLRTCGRPEGHRRAEQGALRVAAGKCGS